MILEKMGTPNLVDDLIKNNIDMIMNSTNSPYKLYINEKHLKADVSIFLNKSDNYKGDVNYKECILSNFKNCIIRINYTKLDKSNIVKNLSHELTHIYELYQVKDIFFETKWNWQEALNKTKSQNRVSGLIRYLRDIIYLSLPHELNSRVSSIYHYLLYKCDGFNREKIIEELKNTNEWANYENLMDFNPDQLYESLKNQFINDFNFLYFLINEINSKIGISKKVISDADLFNFLKKLDKTIKKSAYQYKKKLLRSVSRVLSELNIDERHEDPDVVNYLDYFKSDIQVNRNLKIKNVLEFKSFLNKMNK